MDNFTIGILFLIILYFIPSIIALLKAKSNTIAIILLNLLLGWSIIGWVIALVWSVTKDPKNQTIVVNNTTTYENKDINPNSINSEKKLNSSNHKTNTINSLYSKQNKKPNTKSHNERIETLQKLKKLLDEGILSKEEFEIQKNQILM